jgi:hypothetical protein
MEAGDLQGVFDRLGTSGEKDGLLGTGHRRKSIQAFSQRDVALVGGDLEAGMRELFQLGRNGLLYLRVHVAGVEHRDAAGEIDVAPALDVPDLGVGGALGVDRERVGDTARDCPLAALVKFAVGRQGSSS